MLKPITPSPEDWDQFVANNMRAHVLQQSNWGALKAAFGWDVERVALTDEHNQIIAGAQILFRRLPFRLGTMAYVAMGPLYKVGAQHVAPLLLQTELWSAIDSCSRRHHAVFLKWEPGVDFVSMSRNEADRHKLVHRDSVGTPFLASAPRPIVEIGIEDKVSSPLSEGEGSGVRVFRLSPQTIQPPRTILIDIRADDETILACMNQGTRRKIRQSQKNGIRYWQASRAEVETFTRMMQTTGARNTFGVHEPTYYQKAYDLFVPQGDAALILAEHEGDPLAGIMVFAKGPTAWYLYGASSDIKRNLMATYGVQWAAIQWAKQKGCQWYDLWGIPDEEEATLEAQFESRSDGLWGVYGFKRGWGGQVVRSSSAWDKVYNPLVYAAYQLALRLRN